MSTKIKGLKCPNWIKPRFTPKTKKRVADKRASIYCHDYEERFPGCKMNPGLERCGGNLSVSLRAIAEPDWGGTTPVLDFRVTCDTCGKAYLTPEALPADAEWLEGLIAEALANRKAQYGMG